MGIARDIPLRAASLDRFVPLIGDAPVEAIRALAKQLVELLRDHVVWNVSSTAVGGGVAEMLRSTLGYARGLGIDARWTVIEGSPEFFRLTKRLHNALHGSVGDGSPLGPEQRALYESVLRSNAQTLLAHVRKGDVVVLHDPQTAGLSTHLKPLGAKIIWRCHIGSDSHGDVTAEGWAFLRDYLAHADVCAFSRRQYVPPIVDASKAHVITPAIDPLAPKNQDLPPEAVRAIVAHTGLALPNTRGPLDGATAFVRADGTPGHVERAADVIGLGPVPPLDAPLVVQVSRWDDLKDPIGVMRGFARLVEGGERTAHLLLAGPNVNAVADDPDGARVFQDVAQAFRALPHSTRARVCLASLPTTDLEENAAIVNALQRHATIVVQKSLHEGFGLTVTEAMWKSRPVVASAVGGIVDQIDDGENGLLVRNPRDLDAFAATLKRLLDDRALGERLGTRARERVRERFLSTHSLADYGKLIEALVRK